MATIILAGGSSARMGQDKACLAMGGATILQSLVSRFGCGASQVIVVVRPGQRVEVSGTTIVCDVYEGAGPLGGLHAGLLASSDDDDFLLGCDMPFADPKLAGYLLSLLDGHDAVVPRLERGPEALHAAYRKSCLPLVEANLKAHRYRMTDLLDRIDVLYVEERQLRQHDPELHTFINVNTLEDYTEVLRLLQSAQRSSR